MQATIFNTAAIAILITVFFTDLGGFNTVLQEQAFASLLVFFNSVDTLYHIWISI